MTTKERLHKLVDALSEQEAAEAIQYVTSRRANGSVDEWGDLDAWSDAASRDTMRMLDEEEAAAGLSWEQRDAS
jgi:hypothetical protein